ncbi:hypothetical protein BFP97_13400 [Roseivirga sp. 4D4]|uniref:biopolymer transporter ExbD n=1 Tax=Roseivirga sp. 4D4 TaxID=1889784 RepID=UPI000853782D|nr:biopolymer transporter ExbD [Roseivirga sp. 4D4]OEK02454.1 hypothetical protein BFP97_13400 [Roseivirga sp. 4D4]
MRIILSIALFLSLTSAYSQTACDTLFPKQSLDSIKYEIDAFHLELVQRGLCADTSSKALHDFIKIQAPTLFDTIRRQERSLLTESSYYLLQGDCRLALNEVNEFEKVVEWELRVMNAGDTVSNFSEDPLIAGKIWARAFKDEDFDIQTIRRKFLLTIYSITLPINSNIGYLPNLGDSVVTTPLQIQLLMNQEQEVFVDSIKTDISLLPDILISQISKHRNELTVVFQVSKEVGYDSFLKVLDIVRDAYNTVQNDLAQQLYQKNLDALSEEEAKVVKDSIQRKVITQLIDP